MKYHTTITAKAEILKPKSDEFKAVAASLRDRYGFDLKPQMDLLYVRSCLVSAGKDIGVNENDDIFTREEAWAARHTPVLKPFNWQHQDKDIVGVMYTVQARSTQGHVLDINNETVPDCDFDLFVEAAIFRLIHEERAAEIEARSKAGSLYVSMEAWFDDYSYGFCDSDSGSLLKVVARDENTSFLDKHLRVSSGVGIYRDPESDQDVRIGRVLKSITYGGCGFVDRPANKRSVIEAVEPMNSYAERDAELQVEMLLKKILESQGDHLMNSQANSQGTDKSVEIESAVDSAFDKREKAAAAQKERESLEARATESEARSEELETQLSDLTLVKEAKEVEVKALQEQVNKYNEVVNSLVKESASAGATSSTPSEISSIDSAEGGEAAFSAKIAWIQKSMASLKTRAARADELELQLAEAESVVREQDARTMLGDHFSDAAVEVMVARATELDDEAYASWRDEKELMILEMSQARDLSDKQKKGLDKDKMKKEDKSKDKDKDKNPFAALVAQRRAESMASPDTPTDMGHLINHPGGDGVNSGVSADQLRTPRHKVAGSAGDYPADILDNIQEVSGVSLAGSNASDDGAEISPFRVLAGLVTDSQEEKEVQVKRPGFDPIS